MRNKSTSIAAAFAVAALMVLSGCSGGSKSSSEASDKPFATLSTVPTTLDGVLAVTNTEGDSTEEGGAGEISYGSLTVGSDVYSIEVDTKLLTSAGIPDDVETSRVKATLGARSEAGADGYVITAVSRL